MAGAAAGNATTCGGHAEHPSLFQLASHLDLRYFCWIFVALIFFTIFFEHELEKPVHARCGIMLRRGVHIHRASTYE